MYLDIAKATQEVGSAVFSNTNVLNTIIVAGIVTTIMNILKHHFGKLPKAWYPVCVFLLAGLVNVVNYWLFVGLENDLWRVALREGLIIGAMASSIYSMGKGALNERTQKKQDQAAVEDVVDNVLKDKLHEVKKTNNADIDVDKISADVKKEMIKKINPNRC